MKKTSGQKPPKGRAPTRSEIPEQEEMAPQTRQVICNAMVNVTYAHGYHGTPLRAVANASGIQTASIYYHFASKQEILVEIMTNTLRELTDEVSIAIEQAESDPVSQLRAAVFAHVSFHALRREEAFVTDSEYRSLEPSNREVVSKMRDEYEEVFSRIMRQGQATRDIIEMDERLAVNALLAMCSEVAIWYRSKGRLSISEIAEGYVNLFLARPA